MVWMQSEVKLGGHVMAGAMVTHGRPQERYGLRRPALRSATVTGTALVKDLVSIQETIEKGEPVGQSGVFLDGVSVALTSLSLRCEDGPPGETFASYDIGVMEVRLVSDVQREAKGQY